MPSRREYPIIRPEKIPAATEYEIARKTIKCINRYFDRPDVQARFEAWQKEHGKSQRAERERRE